MIWRRAQRLFWGTVFAAAYRGQRLGIAPTDLHLVIRNALIYDGSGREPYMADVGIDGARIVAIGDLGGCTARQSLDAAGLALAPGFINSLSWATESLLQDPTAASDVRQGVTLEIFGEGVSMGPLTTSMRLELDARLRARRLEADWSTLGEYLERLERRGVVPNVASMVGATTVRVNVMGYVHRAASDTEIAAMCELVREAMREGALGLGSALIYSPAASASYRELLALAQAAADYGGAYCSHIRSETTDVVAAAQELIDIAAATGQHTEIYHLKAAGRDNWHRLEEVIARLETARAAGVRVAANMYPYTSAATGLDATMPPWVQEGGAEAWFARLAEPAHRARLLVEIARPGNGWENLYHAAGGAENVTLLGLVTPQLQHCNGLTLAAVAAQRGVTPEQAIIDLVRADRSRVTAAFELMTEDNVRRQLALPWVSLCSDAEALTPGLGASNYRTHPRAFGAFARFLGHYVRDRQIVPLAEAIRRLSSQPAAQFKLRNRGRVALGCYADLVLFDAARIADHATLADAERLATGVVSVVVNGQVVLRDGRFTGARPGRFVRGPGYVACTAGRYPDHSAMPKAAG
ncbi:MAG: amidohydrolase family protein [Steroidobacteraceae bacterium]